MKRSPHLKSVLDHSWITVDTTSLNQHKLYFCTIALICYMVKVNSTSCVIQSRSAGTYQRLRDSMYGRARSPLILPSGSLVQLTNKKINPCRATTTLGSRLHDKKKYKIEINHEQNKNRAPAHGRAVKKR